MCEVHSLNSFIDFCNEIQYFFDVVRNKLHTIYIYTRRNEKKIKSSRKEYVV